MKRALFILPLALLAATAHAGTAYKWVDSEGKTHYSDQPPPPSAKDVQQKRVGGGNFIETSQLPYGVQDAVRRFPVTLYATSCGDPCSRARDLLNRRGIPYTEKNPQQPADLEALKKLTGKQEVPVLAVGSNTLQGFDDAQWSSALDLAGYPKTAPLPPKKPPATATAEVPTPPKEELKPSPPPPGSPAPPLPPAPPAAPARP